jgi:hypothetical protein
VANFCDWFEPAVELAGALAPEDAARAGLDALFGGGAEAGREAPAGRDLPEGDEDPAAAARRRLDDLFD